MQSSNSFPFEERFSLFSLQLLWHVQYREKQLSHARNLIDILSKAVSATFLLMTFSNDWIEREFAVCNGAGYGKQLYWMEEWRCISDFRQVSLQLWTFEHHRQDAAAVIEERGARVLHDEFLECNDSLNVSYVEDAILNIIHLGTNTFALQ